MVYRVYVEKKKELANEARNLFNEIKNLLFVENLKDLRLLNRYDVENIEKSLFDYAVNTVFSEPQLDVVTYELPEGNATVFAVEYLPGQFDQRADSAAQCIQLFSQGESMKTQHEKSGLGWILAFSTLTVCWVMG